MTNTSDYIYKESQKEFNKISLCCNTYQNIYKITLPTINIIEEILINCSVMINKIKKNKKNEYIIGISIDNPKIIIEKKEDLHIMYIYCEKLPKYSSIKINDFLLKLKNEILPNLKFDKLFGKNTCVETYLFTF